MSRTIHGLAGTRVYKSWDQMKQRCENPRCHAYHRYGGRGITICQFLRSSPANIVIIIGNRPEGLTIDRKDTNGNYSCGSCHQCRENKWPLNIRWADWYQQAESRRNSRHFTYNGVTKIGADWARDIGISYAAFYKRVSYGKTGDELFAPCNENYRRTFQ